MVKSAAMPAHYITRYWEQEQRVFVKNSRILRSGHDREALHDMRVAVKKLRAALEAYIQLTAEPFWENPLSETETLFATVGRLRDVEICQACLREHRLQTGEPFPAFTAFLKSQFRPALRWAKDALADYRPREIEKIGGFLKSEDTGLIKQAPPGKLQELIEAAWQDVPACYRQPHALRKRLKTIYYWMKMLPEGNPVHDRAGELAPLLDQLGAWQDRSVLIRRIRHFRKDYLPAPFPEYAALKEYTASLTEMNRDAMRHVVRELKKFSL